jgi:glucans biosynthesis protein C
MSKSSLALNNLRGVVILIVLAFHAVLAYLGSLPPSAYVFDAPPYGWSAFPIVDMHRWFGFDLFCAWQDMYLMALMFFLSALFTWPGIKRRSTGDFLRGRFQRLGVPYLVGVSIVMPVAIYPVYRVSTGDWSIAAYAQQYLALPFWPNGPLWFLWQLLALTGVAAALFQFAPHWIEWLARRSGSAGAKPVPCFIALASAAVIAYVPMALMFTPWRWASHGLLAVQYCRPLLYAVFYLAGLAVGANGLDRGLLAPNGRLQHQWAVWLAVALGSLVAWMGLTKLGMDIGTNPPIVLRIAIDIAFAVGCAAGSFFLLAVCLRFAAWPSRLLDSFAENAFSLYLFHYAFVVWLQYALLGLALGAVVKAPIVFAGTVVLSWLTTMAVRAVPGGSHLIGAERRLLAKAALPPGLGGAYLRAGSRLHRPNTPR